MPEISDTDWLLRQIDAIDGCERTKDQVRNVLRGMAGARLRLTVRAVVMPGRVRRAVELLDAGRTRVQVRDALLAAGLCHTHDTAYRAIQCALAERCRRSAGQGRATEDEFKALVTRASLTGSDDDD